MNVRQTLQYGLIACMLFGASGAARAFDIPPFTGYRVNDYASLLDRQEAADLEASLAAFEKKTTDQIAVLTTHDLQGQPIEEYANAVFRDWKLGQEDKDNGILVLIAVGEKNTARIEVGYGLEGALPDAVCSAIIREKMRPLFKEKKYAECIAAAVSAIEQAVVNEYTAPAPPAPSSGSGAWIFWIVILAVVIVFFAVSTFMAKNARIGPDDPQEGGQDGSPLYGAFPPVRSKIRSSPSEDDEEERQRSPGLGGLSMTGFREREDDDGDRGSSGSSSSPGDDGPSFSGGGGSSGGGGASGSLD